MHTTDKIIERQVSNLEALKGTNSYDKFMEAAIGIAADLIQELAEHAAASTDTVDTLCRDEVEDAISDFIAANESGPSPSRNPNTEHRIGNFEAGVGA